MTNPAGGPLAAVSGAGQAPPAIPSFRDGLKVWLKIATLSFGGPAGQIAVMHRVLVEDRRWISESRFLHALNYCMLLPGPEAQQLVTYIAWLLHGTAGGIVAGSLFVLPGFLSLLALSLLYVSFHDAALLAAVFYGLKPAVMAIVVEAVVRIGRRAFNDPLSVAIAAAAFVALFLFDVPFPMVIVTAAAIGLTAARWRPALLADRSAAPARQTDGQSEDDRPVIDSLEQQPDTSPRRAVRVTALCLALWFAPVAAVGWWQGPDSTLTTQGVFFSKVAIVTFGGAYSVLSYVAQQAVETHHWLNPGEMLDGLGMAETTPGPLIQVVQFVAFLGAFRNPGDLDPLTAGLLGSILTTWVTYVPCFMFIFVGAPFIESMRRSTALRSALSAITAAVVGVVLNLAVWFSVQTLFGAVGEVRTLGMHILLPEWSTVDLGSLAIAAGAAVAMLRFRVGMLTVLAAAVLAGFAIRMAFGA